MRKLAPYFFTLLGVIACAVAGRMALRSDRFRLPLADLLSQRLHHKVIVGDLGYGLLPPTLKLRDVVVLTTAQDAPLLQVERADVTLQWISLFKGRVLPQAIMLDHWLVTFHRQFDGSWDWGDWFAATAQLSQNSGWPVTLVRLQHGQCRLIDPYGARRQDLVLQSVEATLDRTRHVATLSGHLADLPVPIDFVFQGEGQFIVDPQEWAGRLKLTDENREWALQIDKRANRLNVHSQSKAWRWDTLYALFGFYSRWELPAPTASPTLLLNGWDTVVSVDTAAVAFTDTADLAGGRSELKGSILYSASSLLVRGDAAFKGVAVQPLLTAVWGTSPWEGALTGMAHVEVMLSSHSWQTAQGQGALELKEGRYHWSDTLTKNLARAHLMSYMKKKYPDFLNAGLPVTQASAHWQLHTGVFSVDDGRFNFGDLQAAVVGTLDGARHGVDGYLKLQVREKSPELTKEIPAAYVDRGQGRVQILPMFGHFQGHINELTLRANRSSKIPSSSATKLRKILH